MHGVFSLNLLQTFTNDTYIAYMPGEKCMMYSPLTVYKRLQTFTDDTYIAYIPRENNMMLFSLSRLKTFTNDTYIAYIPSLQH